MEASDIVTITESIVKENQVEDVVKVILIIFFLYSFCLTICTRTNLTLPLTQIIKGKIEDIQLPEKVDIIISEWMGFYLLHEAMLDSVLIARDRFLKKTGILFPDKCKLYAAPCTLPSFYSHWNDVSTVKMDSFASSLRKLYNGKPEINVVSPELLLSDAHCVLELSLADTTSEDLDELSCELFAISKRDGKYQGVCLWFATSFPSTQDGEDPVVLSTAPSDEATHWKQTVLVLQDEVEVEEDEPVAGVLTFRRSDSNARFYNIEFAMVDPETIAHPVLCDCYYPKCTIIKTLSAKYDEYDEMSE